MRMKYSKFDTEKSFVPFEWKSFYRFVLERAAFQILIFAEQDIAVQLVIFWSSSEIGSKAALILWSFGIIYKTRKKPAF